MRKSIVILALLVAQPAHAAKCHMYSKWYYPYPQTCHNNRYSAEFKFMNKLKFKKEVQPATYEVAPQVHPLAWTNFTDFPKIIIEPTVACAGKIEREYGMCLLKIQIEEKRNGTKTDK
jgi:hypothetical protein